jgi:hypothetical protein
MFTAEDKLREAPRPARRLVRRIRAETKMNQLFDAVLEWRDARAAFLHCIDTAPHEDESVPQDIGLRFVNAEEKLFEVANEILML